MKKTLIGMGLGVMVLTLGASRPAEAAALLRLSAGGATVTCDTSAAFVNAIGGNCAAVEGFSAVANASLISFTGNVDGWGAGPGGELRVNGNQPGAATSLAIDVNFNIQHMTGTSDLTVDFGENDYSLPTGNPLTLSGSQTSNWATSVSTDTNAFQVWGRATNDLVVPLGTATATTPLCTSNGTPSNSCHSDSPDVAFVRGVGNFALTGREIIHSAIGTAALYTNSVTVTGTGAVPEPASMLLLGTGLLGLARRASRKGRKQDQAI